MPLETMSTQHIKPSEPVTQIKDEYYSDLAAVITSDATVTLLFGRARDELTAEHGQVKQQVLERCILLSHESAHKLLTALSQTMELHEKQKAARAKKQD